MFRTSFLLRLRPASTNFATTNRSGSPVQEAEAGAGESVHEPPDDTYLGEINKSEWPVAIEYLPEQPCTDAYLGSVRLTDEHLDIKVGGGKFIRRWRIHKALICRYSDYFRNACQPRTIANVSFQEGHEGVFDLHDDNPVAFELFVEWLYSNKKEYRHAPRDWLNEQRPTTWGLYSVEAYVIGDKLMAETFRPFALAHVLDSAKYFDKRDIEIILDTTGPHDPVYKFTCSWVRWRCRQDPILWSRPCWADLLIILKFIATRASCR
jgi:hypothetical protein